MQIVAVILGYDVGNILTILIIDGDTALSSHLYASNQNGDILPSAPNERPADIPSGPIDFFVPASILPCAPIPKSLPVTGGRILLAST